MKNNNITELEKKLVEIKENLSDEAIDFINDYSFKYNNDAYISDLMHEFSDSRVSIYTYDNKKFYFENEDICLEALQEFGCDLNEWLNEGLGLDDMIAKAGSIGEYQYIYNNLSQDEEKIVFSMLLMYCIDEKLYVEIESLENIASSNNDSIEDMIDELIVY